MTFSGDEDSMMASELLGLPSAEGQGAKSDSNPFLCNICKSSYTRVDHLARHYRSHTRERPFICEVCGKSFARADLLKRHANGHNKNSNDELYSKRATRATHRRSTRACMTCAEAKLRREGNSPCARCRNKGIACVYGQVRSRTSIDFASRQHQVQTASSIESIPPQRFEIAASDQLDQHDGSNNIDSAFAHQSGSDSMMLGPINPNQWQDTASTQSHVVLDGDQQRAPTHQHQTDEGSGTNLLLSDISASAVLNAGSLSQPHVSPGAFDELPFADFLRHVMDPTLQDGGRQVDGDAFQPYSRDLLDFNIDQSFDMDLYGFPPSHFLPEQNFQPPAVHFDGDEPLPAKGGYNTPGNIIRASVSVGQQAFKDSIWLWTPGLGDHAGADNANLSLPSEHNLLEAEGCDASPVQGEIALSTRDRILAMVLSTCSATSAPLVVASFPSPELLTKLLNIGLVHHMRGDALWIHTATLDMNNAPPEFLTAVIALGATTCSMPGIRKLGFALYEAVRVTMPAKFEADNRNIRELKLLQAFALHLDGLLWSGDRRKMELAESTAQPVVTMMRRAGSFRRTPHPDYLPQPSDNHKTIESKWRKWAEAESFKRLAFHLLFRDTQTSMSLLNQPIVSFAEFTLELPFSRDLWLANSASEWKELYLARGRVPQDQPPSFRHCLRDTGIFLRLPHIVDVPMALAVTLSSVWAVVWQYRKMKEAFSSSHSGEPSRSNSMAVDSLYQEAIQLMQRISLNATEYEVDTKAGVSLLRELCLMHLHVSLEDVQLLAGKEGEEEARRVFPLLSQWAESAESRQAIFHAGQVIRAAKEYPKGTLRDSSAVAVYQASLVFWAYAVPYTTVHSGTSARSNSPQQFRTTQATDSVRLDADDGSELQRFLVLGKGRPCIHRWTEDSRSEMHGQEVLLAEPVTVMNAITELLRTKNGGSDRSSPPLVSNLSKLMKSLGTAAAAIRKK